MLKSWLDRTEAGLLEVIHKLFKVCRNGNLKISLLKSNIFLKELRWCSVSLLALESSTTPGIIKDIQLQPTNNCC